jgi:Tfp pilus assembly protein PilX
MKSKKTHSTRKANRGNVLFVTLVIIGVVGVALASYLSLVQNRAQLSSRSQSWNLAMPVAEAGVEEAMAHLNYTKSKNLGSNGWTLTGSNVYWKQVSLDVNNAYYEATISTNPTAPVIESKGFVRAAGTSQYISRTVKVTATLPPQFFGAVLSKTTVDCNGNKTAINSYDSRSNLKSTNGKYDSAKKGDKADVLLASSGTDFSLGNCNIWGHAYTASGITVTTGPNGAIGDALWNTTQSGIKPGWWSNTADISVPDVFAPFTSGTSPASNVVVGGVTYDYAISNGNYMISTLDKKCVVTGNAILYVTSNINSSVLMIQSNAAVKIYCGGTSATFNTVNNYATAVALQYFGLPANTSVSLSASWMGGVYAPNADFNITGNDEMSGALVVKSVRMRGNSEFHYDEALSAANVATNFFITSWDEL